MNIRWPRIIINMWLYNHWDELGLDEEELSGLPDIEAKLPRKVFIWEIAVASSPPNCCCMFLTSACKSIGTVDVGVEEMRGWSAMT